MRLFFGVVDVGYTDDNGATTTGDVAEILEDNYHIMRSFLELHEEDIGKILADQLAGTIETMLQRGIPSRNGMNVAMGRIEEAFRDFLDNGEMSRLLPPSMQSKAAQSGISHRKKKPYAKDNPARQAFIDTGLYQASFRAWLTNGNS